tara:strand:- start:813 stop:944 length:132 start_codon:yes stop_codon:yes gene_type:complete
MTSPIKCSQCDKIFPHGSHYREHWEKIHLKEFIEKEKNGISRT